MDGAVKQRAWLAYLILGLALSVAAGFSTSESLIGIVTQLAGWTAAGIGLSIARRSPREIGRPWQFFAGAATAFLVAGLVRMVHGMIIDVDRPFPSPADAIALTGHVMLIIGSTLLGHLRSPDRDRASIIDGAIIAIALETVVWATLLWPYMTDPSIPQGERLINAVYAFMTTIVLATIGRLAVGPGARTLSYRLLAGAVVVIFVQDVLVTVFTVNTIHGNAVTFGRALAPVIFVLFGAAALHPARLRIAEAPARLDVRLTWRRVSLLVGALLVNPAIVGIQLATGSTPTLTVAVLSSIMLTLLVMARFALLARAQERAVEVQRIQRDANADLAAASSRHAMHQATLRAALRLAEGVPGFRASIAQVAEHDLQIIDALGSEDEHAIGTSIAMDRLPEPILAGLDNLEPVAVDGYLPIDLGPSSNPRPISLLVSPLVSQGMLAGALVVSSRRPIPSTLRQSLETLASTVSLALESAALTESLLRRRSERRFRALVENSSDIVLVVDDERLITFASPAVHRLLGLPEQSLMGTHPARWVHADDWPDVARVLDNSTQTGEHAGEIEVRIRHVDGTYRWFEIRTRNLRHDPEIEGLVVTAREVTDRKATEHQLAANEARFRALVQSSSDVVAVIGDDGRFTYVSPAVTEMVGYQPEQLVGTPAFALLSSEDLDHFLSAYPELSQRHLPDGDLRTRRIETQLTHRSGETRTVDITVTDMRHDPAVGGIVLNARDITVRKALERDLRYQALHDTLTGLANRTMFTQQTAAALRAAPSGSAPVGALFIDLDDFKTVNDSLGHAVGDQLLQDVARRLLQTLSPEDLAARLGGDEFAILVVDAEDEAGVSELADRILATVAEPFRIQGREIRVTASIGIAIAEDEATDAEVLLRSADVAMYLAKDGGKNRQAIFEAHMHTSVFERLELKADLIRAIDDGQLRCQYQPIVSLQTGHITGTEALVRWQHPTRGWLTPDSFIPLAEDTGLVIQLGEWVLREACQQLREWQLILDASSTLSMSVNLSVRQLTSENIVAVVRDAIEQAGIDPSTLTLEITETTLMHDTDLTRRRLAELRELGLSLAVDDFGTGYSSLQYVQRFPIDIIKIDRSFVSGLGTNPGDGAVVQSMIELAQRLGVHTTAEGIERPEQVTLLQSLGADLGQGYLFSKPVAGEDITHLLTNSRTGTPRLLKT